MPIKIAGSFSWKLDTKSVILVLSVIGDTVYDTVYLAKKERVPFHSSPAVDGLDIVGNN